VEPTTAQPGWYPVLINGKPATHWWDGNVWHDPIWMFEQQMKKAAEQITAVAYQEGMKAGWAMAHMAQRREA
jgi:hypothetical protein